MEKKKKKNYLIISLKIRLFIHIHKCKIAFLKTKKH